MSTASAVKKSVSSIPVASAAIGNIFSGKIAASPAPTKSKSKKVTASVPANFFNEMRVLVSWKSVAKFVEGKIMTAEKKMKRFFISRWVESFVKHGVLPASTTYQMGDESIDFIQTKRIFLRPENAQILKQLGVDLDSHSELAGVHISYEALERHNLVDKLQKGLAQMGATDEQLSEIFIPKVKAKETLYLHLPIIAKNSLPSSERSEEKITERAMLIYDLVSPVCQLRGAKTPLSPVECFESILSSVIDAESSSSDSDDEAA